MERPDDRDHDPSEPEPKNGLWWALRAALSARYWINLALMILPPAAIAVLVGAFFGNQAQAITFISLFILASFVVPIWLHKKFDRP